MHFINIQIHFLLNQCSKSVDFDKNKQVNYILLSGEIDLIEQNLLLFLDLPYQNYPGLAHKMWDVQHLLSNDDECSQFMLMNF